MISAFGVVHTISKSSSQEPRKYKRDKSGRFSHTGFTGSLSGMTEIQSRKVKELLQGGHVLHVGEAAGADYQAAEHARALGMRIEAHPASGVAPHKVKPVDADTRHPAKPPLIRNKDIVAAADRMVAAPKSKKEELRSGTWATIRHTRRSGKPLTIVYPDGTTDVHGDF